MNKNGVRKLNQDEKVAMVLGVMAAISSMEIPEDLGILLSQRALSLAKKSWDNIEQSTWEGAGKMLEEHGRIMEGEKKKRQEYYDKHSI